MGSQRYTSERLAQEYNHNLEVKPIEPDSSTESDADEPANGKVGKSLPSSAGLSNQDEKKDDRPRSRTPARAPAPSAKLELSSGSESSPHRPTKRPKSNISSDEDSEADNKGRGTSSGGMKRGAAPRQPIKRGGKRF